MSPFDVNDEALRFIVKNLDGDLRLSTDPYSPGLDFLTSCVRDVQNVIVEVGFDQFLADSRGYAGEFPAAGLRPVELLHIAAAIDATEFTGFPGFVSECSNLTDAVRWTLMAVYEDVFSTVGAALEAEELGWNGSTLAVCK
jgi:hypothetical protein